MHIGFDITSLLYARGVSRYTRNLLRALNQLPNISLSLYGSSLRRKHELAKQIQDLHLHQPQVVLQQYPPSLLSKLWQRGLNPIKPKLPGVEVFHAWDWHLPPDSDLPMVITIHDLAMLRIPNIAHPTILKAHRVAWKQLARTQIHIIAVSQTTKRDIVELLEIDPKRISVIYEALPEEMVAVAERLTEEQSDALLERLAISRPYFLFVGTQEPRKNLKRVVRAWQSFAPEYDLVIAGAPGWDQAISSSFDHDPIVLNHVSDEQLSALYDHARLFLFPSLYEGFGLPILESFYHGTPVITSNNSGMAEVAGTAAELVDPTSIDSIKAGIETLLGEDSAAEKIRDQKMIQRLQMFRWDQTALQTLATYQKTKAAWQ